MNIVFVSHYSGKGGANNEMLLLIEQLLIKGHNITVVIPTDGWINSKVKDKCNVIITPYHRWVESGDCSAPRRTISQIVKLAVNWKAANYLADKLKHEKIDLIHTNDSLTVVGAYLAKKLNVPHVWHIREIFDGQFNFKHTYSENYCKKWLNRADYVIAISEAVYDRYKQYRLNNLAMIYDGLKYQPATTQRSAGSDKSVFTMLFCGGTSKSKGFDDVVELAARLVKEGQDFVIKVVASSNVTDQLIHQLKNDGTFEKFQFLGFVNNLNEIRQTCDVMLMCSKDEAFGLVTVESMLAKLPVIGRNSGATTEIIKNGKTGFLYDTVDDLQDKVKYTMSHDLSEIKEQAFNYARENFLIKQTAKKVENIYMQLTSHRFIKNGGCNVNIR